jgi:SRSO17 transposase
MEPWTQSSEARFAEYVDALTSVLGRGDRAGPLKDYCIGLLMPGERKSVEPMAAIVAPARVSAKHQSLLHLVGQAAWSDEAVLAKVRELVLPTIEAQGKIEAWIVDDTGFAKKGVHSVGVTRQYCGRLGKTDNCQIAVTLSIANHAASLAIAYQLYLPEDWAVDEARRKKARVPDDVTFRTKPEIALAQIRTALAAGVAPGVLLADAGYGADGAFRSGVTASGLNYVVGVQSTLSVWPRGAEPLPPKPWSGRGRPPSRMRRDGEHVPVSAKTLATRLPQEAWRIVPWREGSNEILSSRFAAADPAGFAGLEGFDAPSAGMASHRVARGGKRADEILAFDPARRQAPRRSRRHGQIALAHRARLRGTQKRARPRPFRRAKLARIPSSRRTLYRRLRFSHPRASGDSPLRPPAPRNVWPILASQIPRRHLSDPNDISKIRSRRSEDNSRSRSPDRSCAAHVAKPCYHDNPLGNHRDTVELGACPRNSGFRWRCGAESDSAC